MNWNHLDLAVVAAAVAVLGDSEVDVVVEGPLVDVGVAADVLVDAGAAAVAVVAIVMAEDGKGKSTELYYLMKIRTN